MYPAEPSGAPVTGSTGAPVTNPAPSGAAFIWSTKQPTAGEVARAARQSDATYADQPAAPSNVSVESGFMRQFPVCSARTLAPAASYRYQLAGNVPQSLLWENIPFT